MPSAWVAHVKKYYADRKKKEPDYKYKNAMKETYKKVGSKEEKTEKPKPKRRRKRKVEEEKVEKPKPKRRRKKKVPKDFTTI